MFVVPPDFKLMKISSQHVYCDEKAEEKNTFRIKRKYKLAGNVINSLGIYTFFVLTSKKEACQNFLTVCIEEQHWENRNCRYLREISYLDIKRVESLTKFELLEKIDDPENKFILVARLCNEKYLELKQLIHKVQRVSGNLSNDTKTLIAQALFDDVNEVLAKLGLN